jgi:phage terminase large subunit
MKEVRIRFPARPYQKAVIDHFRAGGKKAFEVWHRRAGKDRTATFIESELAFKRVGLYWHALPEYSQSRRVIWDAITKDGERLIDINFPAAIVRKRNEQEMKMELVNGSIWQLVGADNFNSLVGSNPVHVTYSEFALMNPKAREFIRPILAENDGTELFITTPRGYNHAHQLFEYAKTAPGWHTSLLSVNDTGIISPDTLEEERKTMPDELFRQEWMVDFSAANVGAILGRYMEAAEREGRIGEFDYDPDGAEVLISSDIGFRDTASFWFWQPKPDGFALVDYDEDTGLDAGDWIERLRGMPYRLGKLWLPHDAKAKTFQTKRSVLEQFRAANFRCDIVPQTSKSDRINAARIVVPRCRFNRTKCAPGISGLREWSFEYDDERKVYSKEPRHDWASHPGDGFSYGAQVMREVVLTMPKDTRPKPAVTIGEWIKAAESKQPKRARI